MLFLAKARPDLLPCVPVRSHRPALAGIAIAAVLVAGVLSWFASPRPDGLEWSLANAAGTAEIAAPRDGVHEVLADLQSRIAVMADNDLAATAPKAEGEGAWPEVKAGKSFAGLVGAFVTLLLVAAAAFILRTGGRLSGLGPDGASSAP